ncbi:Fe-S-containing hydro-lyase [Alkaliphilus pronyensis]|uniref:Fe-S-containing hydro-lyase n=1 Tax=Alkaliphilus pronyensis TaxID=1482732 RepID=UPI002ED0A97A
MNTIRITTPLNEKKISNLKAGDRVLISGDVYTARDAAHIKLREMLKDNVNLPFNIEGAILYYVGPTPTPPGKIIGSAGPTTSTRMDDLTPLLMNLGLLGMIGKGDRSDKVVDLIKKKGAVYFAAIGGAGALISKSIIESQIIVFPELGTEAIRWLKVKDFPVIVAIDSQGVNLYKTGPANYNTKKSHKPSY